MNHTTTMAAFGASDRACHDYPEDTDIAKAQRAAFCAGSAWSAGEIERLQAALASEREHCATRLEVAADAWIKEDPRGAQRLMNIATQLRQRR